VIPGLTEMEVSAMNDHPTGSRAPDKLAALRGRFPHWEAWLGISGLLYARRRKSSPPVVFRAETAAGLETQIRQYEGRQR
jgi:hypothetical protein